jgi:hypothetical protein
MKTIELIKYLKRLPETAEMCIDDGGGGLLPITNPHIASAKEKMKAGYDANNLIVVIPAEIGLSQ